MFIQYRPQDLIPALDYKTLTPEQRNLLGQIKKGVEPPLEDLAVLDATTPIRVIADVFLSFQMSQGSHIGDFTATLPKDFVYSDDYQKMLSHVLSARCLPSETVTALNHNVLAPASIIALFEKSKQLADYVASQIVTPVLQNLILDWVVSLTTKWPSRAVQTICEMKETTPQVLARVYEKVYPKSPEEQRGFILGSLISNLNTPSSIVTEVFLDSLETGRMMMAISLAEHPNLNVETVIHYATRENVTVNRAFIALAKMTNSAEAIEQVLTSWGFSLGSVPMPADFLQDLYKETVEQLAA